MRGTCDKTVAPARLVFLAMPGACCARTFVVLFLRPLPGEIATRAIIPTEAGMLEALPMLSADGAVPVTERGTQRTALDLVWSSTRMSTAAACCSRSFKRYERCRNPPPAKFPPRLPPFSSSCPVAFLLQVNIGDWMRAACLNMRARDVEVGTASMNTFTPVVLELLTREWLPSLLLRVCPEKQKLAAAFSAFFWKYYMSTPPPPVLPKAPSIRPPRAR